MFYRDLVKLWLPVVVWMALIFWWSSIPQLAVGEGLVDYWTRKPAHVAVYALLWLLLYRAVRGQIGRIRSAYWQWRPALVATMVSFIYALSDEYHQSLVPTRSGTWTDVLFDVGGIVVGMGLMYWWLWWNRALASADDQRTPPSSSALDLDLPMNRASLDDVHQLAQRLAGQLKGGEIICLSGDLGAGKTTFVQALARNLGISQPITSPTFSLEQTYQSDHGLTLRHYDWYRLDDSVAVSNLGVQDHLGQPGTICVIEWPERAAELLPPQAVWLYFAYVDQSTRRITDHP